MPGERNLLSSFLYQPLKNIALPFAGWIITPSWTICFYWQFPVAIQLLRVLFINHGHRVSFLLLLLLLLLLFLIGEAYQRDSVISLMSARFADILITVRKGVRSDGIVKILNSFYFLYSCKMNS